MGIERDLTSGQKVKNYRECGLGGDYLFIALPQGKVNEKSSLCTKPLQLLLLFPLVASENVLGNMKWCLEDRWNYR